jgi:hypothetical protein
MRINGNRTFIHCKRKGTRQDEIRIKQEKGETRSDANKDETTIVFRHGIQSEDDERKPYDPEIMNNKTRNEKTSKNG